MVKAKVDPAALLVAVFAVGIGPLTENGPWEPINSGISAIVLVVLVLFVSFDEITERQLFAFCLVIGFTAAVALAWLVQTAEYGGRAELAPDDRQVAAEAAANNASIVAIWLPWAVAFIAQPLVIHFGGKWKKRGSRPQPSS